MQIGAVQQGRFVRSGNTIAQFLYLSGPDACVELLDGRRVTWSASAEVTPFEVEEREEADAAPRLEARLAELEQFAIGKYAPLGLAVTTECTPLPKSLHPVFVAAALGAQPEGAIVCRRCTTKLCVRADHLFWGTRSDCQRDMCLRGVARPGGKVATAAADVAAKLRSRLSRLKGDS